MAKAPKKACKGCVYCIPYYGNLDKYGKRVISRYWCIMKSSACNDPKQCVFRKGEDFKKKENNI